MKVVMFVRNDLTAEARVMKEAASLVAAGHVVTVVGSLSPESPVAMDRSTRDGIEALRVRLPRWRRWWRWVRWPSRLWARIRRSPQGMDTLDWLAMWRFGNLGWARAAARAAPIADAHHGHDLAGLAAAELAARRDGARLVYDSHELYLASAATVGRPRWAVARLDRLERRLAARCDALITVNEAVAERLVRRLDVGRVVVVHNCPPRPTGEPPGDDRIRGALGLPTGTPVVLHHGSFRPGRGLEMLLAAFRNAALADVHLVFLGFGPLRPMLETAAADPSHGGRVHVLDPVSPGEVVAWVASADLEGLLFEPTPLNHYVATPNKLFESLAAGIPVVASDFPGFRRVLIEDPDGPLGALCDPLDAAAVAAAIRSIVEQPPDVRAAQRARCRKAAVERWNWETESTRLIALYRDLEAGA